MKTMAAILSVLLGQAGGQLDDESLCTFMPEAVADLNCCLLMVENLSTSFMAEPVPPNCLLKKSSNGKVESLAAATQYFPSS